MDLQKPLSQVNPAFKRYADKLEKLGIATLEDLLMHLPNRYEDYSLVSPINLLQPGETVTVKGEIIAFKNQYLSRGRVRTIQRATLSDTTGSLQLLWFNQPYLQRAIPVNTSMYLSGRVEKKGNVLSMTAPAYEIVSPESLHTGRLVPVYPETKGISSKWLRKQIYEILVQNPDIPEYMPAQLLESHKLLSLSKALHSIHFPQSLEEAQKARDRLAFDELFFMQLEALEKRASWNKKNTKKPFEIKKFEPEITELLKSLPFTLTKSQQIAIKDIATDLSMKKPMNRLLQGDVGSGKTVVSATAMYYAYLNGFHSVLMAPTELLANQHYQTIQTLLSPFGLTISLRTGTNKKTEGTFDILVGTHAVLSKAISFQNVGLVVIDEQQRFGVAQRSLLREKGDNPHLLTMTATPIPRTVALTMYGDLDLSYINEMPKGRRIVKTWLVPPEKRTSAYAWIKEQLLQTASQAYIICPFIEESENMQTVKAAVSEYEILKKDVYPDLRLGLLHGRLKAKETESILHQFREYAFDILVATPVVEVGIDVANATIIVIEASERFGLAQLHQLRGRVGRGDKQSYCLLFTENTDEKTLNRLKSLERVYQGAELAELDLKLRGPGSLFGTMQHGIAKLNAASFSDTQLIITAKHAAQDIFPNLERYPILKGLLQSKITHSILPD